jgi:predicted transcriptional regulator
MTGVPMLARSRGRREVVDRSEAADRMLKPRPAMPSKAPRPPLVEYESRRSHVPGSLVSPLRSSSSARNIASSSERPRSALKIRLDILETVRDEGSSKPTRIRYMTKISHQRFVKYLGELVSRGLLMENRDTSPKSYSLTAKGFDFIDQVKEAEAFVASFGLTM